MARGEVLALRVDAFVVVDEVLLCSSGREGNGEEEGSKVNSNQVGVYALAIPS